MKQLLSSLYFFTLTIGCFGQDNLVQNGSFEQGDHPWNYEVVSVAPPWNSFHTTGSTTASLMVKLLQALVFLMKPANLGVLEHND
ncbi:MAG: hypothetical protein ACI9LA_000005 [Bacteroidia bacterium]|jgi:hypothetical protein